MPKCLVLFICTFIMAGLFINGGIVVFAQDIMGGANPVEGYNDEQPNSPGTPQSPLPEMRKQIEFGDQIYHRPTYAMMSKIYWMYDFPDLNSNDDLDVFMQINECDIYRQYYHNEIKWRSIRDTIREYLRENKANFPRTLYFDVQITFGRYDMENGFFPVTDQNFVKGIRQFIPFSSSLDWKNDHCNFSRQANLQSYPRQIMFLFKRPLIIQRLPVDKEGAEKVIRQWNSYRGKERVLYTRVYLTIKKFEEYRDVTGPLDPAAPVFSANIDGYEIYKDLSFTDPLYSKNLLYRR